MHSTSPYHPVGLPSFQSAKPKIAPARRNQNRNSKWYATKDKVRGGGHRASNNQYNLSTPSSRSSFFISWFEGAEVWLGRIRVQDSISLRGCRLPVIGDVYSVAESGSS